MNTSLKNKVTLLALAMALLNTPAAQAQVLNFGVTLNTAGMSADSANTPFFLDFQLNTGSAASPADTVTLSGFSFTGGSVIGTPTTTGTATGTMTSQVVLAASTSSQFNELYQQFGSGTTAIHFTASVHEPDLGGTPSSFTTAIMDSSLGFPAQIFTTAPDTASMVVLNLSPTNTIGNVGGFMGVSSADGVTTLSGISTAITVPEPSTTAAIAGGVVALAALYFRRLRKLPTVAV